MNLENPGEPRELSEPREFGEPRELGEPPVNLVNPL